MVDLLAYEFMQNAILTGIMASVICGVVGPFIVARRMVFVSGGLSHAAFGGLGIAYWLGISPLIGASLFVLLSALIISYWKEHKAQQEDLLIGILWASGVAVGILFIHMTPGYAPDLMAFLFGNILTVSRFDLYTTFALLVLVTVPMGIFFKGMICITFDEEHAHTRMLPVKALSVLFLCIVALSIVTLIQVVGIILVIALITIPVALANGLTERFSLSIALSILLGVIFTLSGLSFSYLLEIPSGATIILIGTAVLIASRTASRLASACRKVPERIPQEGNQKSRENQRRSPQLS